MPNEAPDTTTVSEPQPAKPGPHDGAAATQQRPGTRARSRRRWLWLLDAALLGLFYSIYTLVRNTVPSERQEALRDARAIFGAENRLHLDPEHAMNSWTAAHPVVANIADYYYAIFHFAVVIAVLSWLYWRRREVARRWAAAWYVMNLVGLLGFWLYPTAPPRLLPGAGFVDTVVRFHTWGSWGDSGVASASNQFAAFPSLHEGWALWAAIAIAANARRRWVRIAAFGYPVATALVVLATANHFLIDVAAGVATCAIGFAVVWGLRALARPRVGAATPQRAWWRRPVLVLALVLALIAGVGAAAIGLVVHRRSDKQQQAARRLADQFLADWASRRFQSLGQLTTGPAGTVADYYSAAMQALHVTAVRSELGAVTVGKSERAAFTAQLTVSGYGTWTYNGVLPLVMESGGRWLVRWTPAALNPALRQGERLGLSVRHPTPGHLLDDEGDRIRGADSELTDDFLGPPSPSGSEPRLLSSRLADVLDGTPSATICVVDASGRVAARLHTLTGISSRSVRTTLDLPLQQLAEQVVDESGGATSLVAIDTSTGAVKAVADNPLAGEGTALRGRFAPGSTFKIVTATAALENGYNLQTTVDCPPFINGGGFVFHNAGGEAYGPITFEKAFAVSCNTAFIGIAESLPKGALAKAATFYGCTILPASAPQQRALTVPSFACNYPPAQDAEYAASAFGQGQDQVSPLGLTAICAAAANGTWHPPRVLPAATPGARPAAARQLPATVVGELHTAMRAVVTSGTATSIAGTPIAGKTGTAEYGTGDPPPTNAWFTGYLGRLAVTVLVQDSGYGGAAAAPLVARFLTAAQSYANA